LLQFSKGKRLTNNISWFKGLYETVGFNVDMRIGQFLEEKRKTWRDGQLELSKNGVAKRRW
jgi:hypothetical protein